MGRGRYISKRISKSDKIAKLHSMHACFLYVICYTHADVEGRCTAEPGDIRDNFLGNMLRRKYSVKKIAEYLEDMADVKLIILYEAKEKRFMQFVNFHEHQSGLRKDREAPSSIPAPKRSRAKKTELRSNSGVTPELSKAEVKETEEKKKEAKKSPSEDSPPLTTEDYLLSAEIQTTSIKWNDFAKKHDLAEIREIKKKTTRRSHVIARLKEGFRIEEVVEIIEKSPFLLGQTKAGFRVFFDWIILPTNYQKILEGTYVDKKFSSYKAWLLKKKKQKEEK